MADSECNIIIGEIINTFGHKGEVKVYPHTDFPEHIASGKEYCVRRGDTDYGVMKVTRSRMHKGVVIVKFAGIDDMNAAEDLRGANLYIREEELMPLAEDEYYIHDIIGMDVVTTEGENLGKVTEVLRSPANDVYVTEKAMVPAVKEFVVSIDLHEKKMVVNPVEGMIQEQP